MNSTYLHYRNIQVRKKSVTAPRDFWSTPRKSLEYEDHYDIITEAPPSYESAISETELKRWTALETINTDAVRRTSSSSSLSSLSSEGGDELVAAADIPSILTEIKLLRKEQEDMKQKQMAHEEHLKTLLEREPELHKRLECVTHPQTHFKDWSKLPQKPHHHRQSCTKEMMNGLSEEIFIQLEQIYVNSPAFAVQRTKMDNPKTNDFTHDVMKKEIISLREKTRKLKEKVSELEGELKKCNSSSRSSTGNKTLSSPPVHSWGGSSAVKSYSRADGKQDEAYRLYCPNSSDCRFVVGKPTPPLPARVVLQDIKHIEMIFKWTIAEYSVKLTEELSGISIKQVSSPFYLSHCGYRCQLESYLNGDGTATNKSMSVFLRVIKGDYDRHLIWPVNLSLEIVLLNQSETCIASLKAGGNQFQYRKPSGVTGADSESWGLVEFIGHDVIKTRNYIRDDQIILNCRVTLLQ